MNIPDWTYEIPYKSFRGELVLKVNAILTEPVCPVVSLMWETSGEVLCSFHRDTIQESIDAAVEWAKANIEFKKGNQNDR